MTRRAPFTPWILIAVAIFGWTLYSFARHPIAINHDVAMYVAAAEVLVDGGVPYVDFVDVNPPLIVYLNAVPVLVSRALGVHPIAGLFASVWLFSVVVAWLTRWLFAGAGPAHTRHADWLAIGIAAASFGVWRHAVYGQREHLFALAVLPFFVTRMRRYEGNPVSPGWAIVVGVLAGLMTCLKPHFLLMLAVPELVWFWTTRRVRLGAELFAVIAVGSAYAAHLLLIPSPMRDAFLSTWLPLISSGYEVYDAPLMSIITTHTRPLAFGMVTMLLLLVPTFGVDRGWRFSRPLVGAAFATIVLLFAQRKGFYNHVLPLWVFGGVAGALAWAEVLQRVFGDVRRRMFAAWAELPVYALMLVVTLPAIAATVDSQIAALPDTVELAEALSRYTKPGDPVLVVDSGVGGSFPALLQMQRRPGSRMLFFFPVPMLYSGVSRQPGEPFPYRATSAAPAAANETAFLDLIAEDITRRKPAAIFLKTGPCQACPEGFILRDYVLGAAPLTSALDSYVQAEPTKDFAIYVQKR